MSDQENMSQEGSQDPQGKKRTRIEELEVTGSALVERIKELVQTAPPAASPSRRKTGNELMTVPLTIGVVAGGLVAWAAPLLAAVGALAALVTRVKLESRPRGGRERYIKRAETCITKFLEGAVHGTAPSFLPDIKPHVKDFYVSMWRNSTRSGAASLPSI